MFKKIVIVALLGLASAENLKVDGPCCNACSGDGIIKTFSIDKIFNMCGESCMASKDFWKYHIFERGLTKADDTTAHVCAEKGYHTYDSTVTHGIPGIISMTLDLYKPDSTPEPTPIDPEESIMEIIVEEAVKEIEKIIEHDLEVPKVEAIIN